MMKKTVIWGTGNNWEAPEKILKFNECENGHSVEWLSEEIFLRGGVSGILRMLYFKKDVNSGERVVRIHKYSITNILRIGKNTVVTIANDAYMKVINPILKKCYFKFKRNNGEWLRALTKLY